MLGFLEKLTLTPDGISANDIKLLRAADLSEVAIEDAIHVCTIFNVYDRLADAFEFHIPSAEDFQKGATMLLKRGYR